MNKLFFFFGIWALLFTGSVSAQSKSDTLKYCIKEGIGVGGYDPVNYFESQTATLGKIEYELTFENIKYRFISEGNKKKFEKAPVKYLPQFGGWCSMTLAMGRATTPKYDNFAIISGKLYLFERTVSVNGKELWLKSPEANEKVAKKNYKSYAASGQIK
jgi:YHS domain-containing protein